MRETWHVYMGFDGRMAMVGLNEDNVEHMADALDDMVRNGPKWKR